MQSKKLAVIGIGNTLRGDDGIGIMILESLLTFCKRKKIDCFNYTTASFDLVNKLGDYEAALLIDGINASLKPGEMKIFELSKARLALKPSMVSSHELNLNDLAVLSKKLKIKTRVLVAGIQVEDVGFKEGLSGALKRVFKRNKKEIVVFIENFLKAD